jgi:hypothetical protein
MELLKCFKKKCSEPSERRPLDSSCRRKTRLLSRLVALFARDTIRASAEIGINVNYSTCHSRDATSNGLIFVTACEPSEPSRSVKMRKSFPPYLFLFFLFYVSTVIGL